MSEVKPEKRHTDLSSSTANWVRHNVHRLETLPAPGDEWKGSESDFDGPLLVKLQHEGIIEKCYCGDRVSGGSSKYRTTVSGFEGVQKFLKRSRESDRLLPCSDETCPGRGFRTTSDGLECKHCGEVHDKEDVR